jgi:phospholipid/cholesterol/gamma-HCH transport system substrate-binding protein
VSSVLRDDRDSIKNLLGNGASAVSEINKLLVENRTSIAQLFVSAAQLAAEGKQTLVKLNAGLGDGKPVASLIASADSTLRAATSSLTTLTPNANALMTDATRVTGLLTEPRLANIDKAIESAGGAAQKAGTLLDNTNGVVVDLRNGKGTAGSLLSRDELYSDLRELIRDLKRNPWKLFWKE